MLWPGDEAALPVCLVAPLLALGLAACAADKDLYPSLARRDVERSGAVQPAAPTTPPLTLPADPRLAPRLDRLVEQARAAHEQFATRRERAEQLAAAASGSAIASEGWAVASVALADLESSRSEAMIALADLDELYAAARVAGGQAAEIVRARDTVSAWIGEEDGVLAALRGRLGG